MSGPNFEAMSKISSCNHSNYLFSHPFCWDQTLLKKILNIAFHVLTFGIPLAIYHVISCYFPKTFVHDDCKYDLLQASFDSVKKRSIQPYSLIGQQALEFARTKLKEHPEITPHQFLAGPTIADQPVNQEIALLNKLYMVIYFRAFKEAIMQNKDDPWSQQAVIDAADACMKIGYAISSLTLDDLKSFTQRLFEKGENRTYAKSLTKQDSYQHQTFYNCTNIYHCIRGASTYSIEQGLYYPHHDIPQKHAKLFYQKETIQNGWNTLYNDYCDRIRLYVSEDELNVADSRYVSWTKKDTGFETFHAIPSDQ